LSIVRTLVTTELGGTIAMRRATTADSPDAEPVGDDGPGTVIELTVPLGGN
jgi:hypothetical protein